MLWSILFCIKISSLRIVCHWLMILILVKFYLQMSGKTSLLVLNTMKIHLNLNYLIPMISWNFAFGPLTGGKHWPELVDILYLSLSCIEVFFVEIFFYHLIACVHDFAINYYFLLKLLEICSSWDDVL